MPFDKRKAGPAGLGRRGGQKARPGPECLTSEKSAEADHLLYRHHGFANAVAVFQVSIALGAVAALTRSRPVWWGSLLLGAAGIGLFLVTLPGWPPGPADRRTGMTPSPPRSGRGGSPRPAPEPDGSGHLDAAL
ncbi:MAG: DUF4337 family protein [Thermoanaerobaculia bacterium]